MRLSALFLSVLVSACASPEAAREPSQPIRIRPASVVAPKPSPALDPGGRPSSLTSERDVVVDGISIVGRWEAQTVLGDEGATDDLRRGVLTKVLVVNPTGRAILRGWDSREAAGVPVSLSGRIEDGALRLAELPGAALLHLREGRLHLTDPGGTTTVFVWQER